jgi:4-diphosphocytidyl-2-C-methyl-D-erythritol kinase
MMTPIAVNAPAKINLTLTITGRRDDGYHLMDSLVVFAQLADVITLEPADEDHLIIAGGQAAPLMNIDARDNLIMKAISAYRNAAGWAQPLAVHLEKNIPIAAGIGGGSSDAAAVLSALNRHSPTPLPADELMALGLTLGADIPICLAKHFQSDIKAWRMGGIGEKVAPLSLPSLSSAGLILLNPQISLSTKDVFTRLNFPSSSKPIPDQISSDLSSWLERGNDLLPPAQALAPEIGSCLADLSRLSSHQGYRANGMSGSGATCFALFDTADQAKKAAGSLEEKTFWQWAGALA